MNTRPVANRLTTTGNSAMMPSRKPQREKQGVLPGVGGEAAAVWVDEVIAARLCSPVCVETAAKSALPTLTASG